MKVTPREEPVLIEMINGYEGEFLNTFHNLSVHLQMEKRDVRNICRALKRKGLAELTFGSSSRDDGMLHGSGYVLTELGYETAKQLVTK